MAKPVYTADASLITHLRNFYSIGQLQLFYCTLTDDGELPGWSDRKRAEWTDGIAKILGKKPMTILPLIELPEPRPQPAKPKESKPSIETPKMDLEKAQRLARGLVLQLEDYCDKIFVAGSIRRQKSEVKDIEIVCQPKLFPVGTGLFDNADQFEVIPAFRREVEGGEGIGIGKVLKGKASGRYMMIELPSGLKLDLFMPSEHDFYRQFAIRTGSADYSQKVIATGWKKKGWCGTDQGLRRISDCEETKSGWKIINPKAELPPHWKSEQEFFSWLGVKWIDPKDRN
ncbi:hypothetical protein GO755_29770 [Spirosoma sp. HMF4905]|uniref:DNA polymerase beta thumb domain-containing protein n=1 Tax=Spirosoma arboris TaxID=2682092 RepID=A0A7K1SL09_9BACT|nr:hypothetical protein [Spirosoma arboris]MVM34256.1 hypothetical protein [Spirosoma arboris]